MSRQPRPFSFVPLGAAALVAGLLTSDVITAPAHALATSRASGPIASSGPLTKITTSGTLRCQVEYNGVKQFYGAESCYTSVAAGGTVMGMGTAWTAGTQELSGVGSKSDPFVLTTTSRGGGWTVTKIDRYIAGKGDYDSVVQVTNTGSSDREAVVSHAADCYLQGGDSGYGKGDAEVGAPTCLKNPPSSADPGQVESFIPRTPGAEFAYGHYNAVYGEVKAGRPLGNRMLTSGESQVDNGMGISWTKTIDAGATETFGWQNHFLTGEDPQADVTANGSLIDTNRNGHPDAGEEVQFTLDIENSGTVTLHDGAVASRLGVRLEGADAVAVGETATFTSTEHYRLTQEDIDNGAIDDSMVFSARTPKDASFTAEPADAEVELPAAPLGSTSTSVSGDVPAAGSKVHVTSTLRNTGNVTLSDLAATVNGRDIALEQRSIAPGGAVDHTIEHEVTQEEFDAGRIDFRTEATGNAPAGNPITLTASTGGADFDRQGQISAELSTVADGEPGVGDGIGLRLVVTNDGNASVRDVAVELDKQGLAAECAVPSLAPGASVECDVTGSYEVTQDDVDAGSVPFRAAVTATDTAGAAVSAQATATQDTVAQAPAVTTTLVPELRVDAKAPVAGDVVALTVRIANSGNVTLRDAAASIADRNGLGVVCPDAPVAPGAAIECTVPEYALTQDDVDTGEVVFDAAVTATGPKGQAVEGADSATVTVDRQHGVIATASAALDGGADAPNAGEHVELAVTARNSGNTTLRDFSAEVDGRDLEVTCGEHRVAPGAEIACAIADHVLTQAEVDAGMVEFDVRVTANGPGGARAEASDSASVELARVPGIEMSATSVLVANEHEVPLAGDTATVEMTIRNTGNITVTGVRGHVADRDGLEVDCPTDELAPGEDVTCVVSEYTLTQADVDAGVVRFDVTAAATGSNRERVEAAADTTLSIVRAPSIEATATSALDDTAAAHTAVGDTATVRFTMTNTGNVTVRDLAGIVEARDGMTITCETDALAPGKTADCVASKYALTQGDIDAGTVEFAIAASATGSNGQTVTASATTTVDIERAPSAEATVTAHLSESEHEAPEAGDRVTVSVRTTNTGNVSLTDARAEVIELADLPVECAADGIAPGASIDCTVPEYVLTQSDIDHGRVSIAAVIDATGPAGDTVTDRDEVQVGLDAKSVLDVTAEPMVQDSDGGMVVLDQERALRPGDQVWVRYSVANTGNLVVNALQSMDEMPAMDVDQPILQPGERTTAMTAAAHTVTDAEAAEGTVVLIGQVKGQVTRADGATVQEPGAASTGQTDTANSITTTAAADVVDVDPAAAQVKPVWVFSTEVRTIVQAEPAPIELAFTGSEITRVVLPAGIVLLLAGLVLLLWVRRRRQDGDDQARHRA